jgi:diaminopimelate epimerase
MRIPFAKAHGARNDFLLTWAAEAPPGALEKAARAICDRHAGVGADGWILVSPPRGDAGHDGAIRLFNSDGSGSEISGNGTRCAAAFLLDAGLDRAEVRILTGAGVKHLRVLERNDLRFLFEMNMGAAHVEAANAPLPLASGTRNVAVIRVGNPQCAVEVDSFDFDWRALGREIETHPRFPDRTNVSFFRAVDGHAVEVKFWERGAGETMSSGTGSTGAAAAAIARGLASSPVRVLTDAGPLDLREAGGEFFLTGPAEITCGGEFYFDEAL